MYVDLWFSATCCQSTHCAKFIPFRIILFYCLSLYSNTLHIPFHQYYNHHCHQEIASLFIAHTHYTSVYIHTCALINKSNGIAQRFCSFSLFYFFFFSCHIHLSFNFYSILLTNSLSTFQFNSYFET